MLTSADYREMANRSAQLAIASPAPSVAEALLALALHYMTQSASCGLSTSQQLLSWPRFLWTPHCPLEPRRNGPHEGQFS